MDFLELIHSDKKFQNKELSTTEKSKMLVGKTVIINGEVENIIVKCKYDIIVVVTVYDKKENGEFDKYKFMATFKSKEYYEQIRHTLEPGTQCRIVGKIDDYILDYIHISDPELEVYNMPLRFPHYVCPKCKYDFGIDTKFHTCLLGHRLTEVYDMGSFYSEE